jgi:CheY-like chemotaxis protein
MNAGSSGPILLVEDNPMDVDLTLQAFDAEGLADVIVVCPDGEDALTYMGKHALASDPSLPRLVLLDLCLPNVDGLDVLCAMRAHPTWRKMPIVVLTTSSEPRDIDRAYCCGANSYIVKPVDFDAFADIVSALKSYWCRINQSPFQPGDE